MKKNKGFTLVELMVVIVIIGILAALAIPKLLAATSKAKLSEFKPVLKTIYTLQEAHLQEAGVYGGAADTSVIGYKTPGGRANFDYAIAAGTGVGTLGTATTKANVTIKLSDDSKLGGATGVLTACVDTTGAQFANNALTNKDQLAKDAGLIKAGSSDLYLSTCAN